jgi:putative FmdB family regulatory protein
MPIYEFHCEKCKKESEILVRSSKWRGAKCPHCGSTKLVKKLSVFASSVGNADAMSMPPCGNPSAACAGDGGGCCCGGGAHRH